MNADQVKAFLQRRPAVHQLCAGAWIQAPFLLAFDVLVAPLSAIGFRAQAVYVAQYADEFLAGKVDASAFNAIVNSGSQAFPVIALCAPLSVDAKPEHLETVAAERLERARQAVAWATADEVRPFGLVVATSAETFFRVLPPHSRRRQRLFGIGGTAADFQANLSQLVNAAERDEHFAFALSLHHDAMHEVNTQFRIARLFNVLECLAARLKSDDRPSRQAVKFLIGLPDGPSSTHTINGKEYKIDAIEIGGRIRDKLFHGVPFRREDLNEETRPSYELYETTPRTIAESLSTHCELELSKWANGTSKGAQ